MDPRYRNDSIFHRRNLEWDKGRIREQITKIFKNIELLEGWKFIECNWFVPRRTRNSSNEELKKHITSSIKVVIQEPTQKELVYVMHVPDLVDNQFFYIGGNLKVPIFQIFDYPIIYRNSLVKLKTNTTTMIFNTEKAGNKLHIFNRHVPIEELLTMCYTREELEQFFINKLNNNKLSEIWHNCQTLFDTTDQKQRIIKVGTYFSNENVDEEKKGKSIIFSLNCAYKIDFYSQKFFKTNGLLFELLNAVHEQIKSDTDIRRKRVRFSEYILAPLVKKAYDMMLTLYNSKKVKFQIPQSILVDECNVSEIIHYNFPVNPSGEISSMCQLALTGPGGFKKKNVPPFIRDLDDSQFGYICGADTPDREGCGVILNMVPTVELDELGNFKENNKKVITSYTISNVPFLEHDDPTRLQMSSNQMKQSIMIVDSEQPIVKSGVEDVYLEHSTFLHRAKQNGVVVHLDNKFMLVSYENGTSEVFKISYRGLYLGATDKLDPCFNEGDSFKKGDVLCESCMIKRNELALGKNLLTGVIIWKGFNYEDGIIISESVSKTKLTSLHSIDITFTIESGQVLLSLNDDQYTPIPEVGMKLKKGDICAKIKTLDGEDGFESINIEPYEILAPLDCTITDIEIYPNTWNKKIREFNDFIESMSIRQTDKYVILYNKLLEYMPKDEVNKFVTLNGLSRLNCLDRTGKYSSKGQKFNGVMIKIQAIYEEHIGIGDKMANRHGNKGVIANIVPDELMPVLPDGRRAQVLLNPMGVPSRMNAGQLYEIHLTELFYHMKNMLKSIDGLTKEETILHKTCLLKQFIEIIDKTDTKWVTEKIISEYQTNLENDNNSAEDKLYLIQPPFRSIKYNDLVKLRELTGNNFSYQINDPSNNMPIQHEIYFGYLYFLKLIHRSSDKTSARSIGPYSKKTLQPLGGKSRAGGHRLGEMETWSLIAHGAYDLLEDFLTVQSDSTGLKNQFLAGILQNPELNSNTNDCKPQSLKLFEAYLKMLGLKIER